jgi:hypothetical protein
LRETNNPRNGAKLAKTCASVTHPMRPAFISIQEILRNVRKLWPIFARKTRRGGPFVSFVVNLVKKASF